jgi:acetyltransferase-like isoleucine patch superfamily enzyme
VLKQGITISDKTVIGAGAVCIRSVDAPNTIQVGVPAKPM